MRHPGQVLTRSQIYERVWDYDFGPLSNSLSVYIGYLRRKLEEGGEPRVIQTVRGMGYVLRDPGAMTLRTRLALAAGRGGRARGCGRGGCRVLRGAQRAAR